MKKILPILFSIFLDAIGFSFIFPIIPFIIKGFGGDVLITGIAVSIAAIGMAIGGLLFGRLSDHFGRKYILIITIVLNIAWYITLANADTLFVFIIARFLSWLGGGGVAVAQAYLGDTTASHDRVTVMGYTGAALGIGFTVGPLMGSLFYSLHLREIGYISALVLLVSLINILIFLPAGKDHLHPEHVWLKDITHSQKNLIPLYSILFLAGLTTAWVQTILGWYLASGFSFTEKQVAMMFGYMGVIAIVYQGFALAHVKRLLSESHILVSWLGLLSFGLVVMGLPFHIFPITLWAFTLAVVWLSSVNATIYTFIANRSHFWHYGRNMGIATVCTSLADIIGPIGISHLYTWYFGLPFYVLSIIVAWSIVFLYKK